MLNGEFASRWMERRYVHRSGRTVWTLVSTTLVSNAQHVPLYMVVMVQDITERKSAEEELQVQKAYFQRLFEKSPEGIVILDGDDRIVEVNSEFTNMFGYTIEEIRGKKVNDVVVPPELKAEAEQLSWGVYHDQIVKFDTVRQRKDGTLIDVSVLGSPITLGGTNVGCYGIYRDITERKHAEEQLLMLSRAVEQSPASIVITDTNGIIEYVNARFVQVTGYSAEEAIGKNPRLLNSGQEPREKYAQPLVNDHLGRGMAGRVPQPQEERRAVLGIRLHFSHQEPGRRGETLSCREGGYHRTEEGRGAACPGAQSAADADRQSARLYFREGHPAAAS